MDNNNKNNKNDSNILNYCMVTLCQAQHQTHCIRSHLILTAALFLEKESKVKTQTRLLITTEWCLVHSLIVPLSLGNTVVNKKDKTLPQSTLHTTVSCSSCSP